MEYRGSFRLFDPSRIQTYPLRARSNKVGMEQFVDCAQLRRSEVTVADPRCLGLREKLASLTHAVAEAHRARRPVILQTGAHSIKNGLSPIWIDLMERGILTLVAANFAAAIHSFELALTGASSESVDQALPKGEFGMAFETGAYLNQAMIEGHRRAWGLGESIGRLFSDDAFRRCVLAAALEGVADAAQYYAPYGGFPYASTCLFARATELGVPVTVPAMIGTDITDQHPSFDGEAKGGTSARDFLIYTEELGRLTHGGVVLNVGTAVMGPEVLLKAVSMVTNQGRPPWGIVTGDFDIRPFAFDDTVKDEGQYYYYLRDQKTIATRLPRVFGGTGYYIEGEQTHTVPAFYQLLMRELDAGSDTAT
jgi:hypothetical protein